MFNKRHSDRWADKQAVRVINFHRDTLGLVFNHSWEGGREEGRIEREGEEATKTFSLCRL